MIDRRLPFGLPTGKGEAKPIVMELKWFQYDEVWPEDDDEYIYLVYGSPLDDPKCLPMVYMCKVYAHMFWEIHTGKDIKAIAFASLDHLVVELDNNFDKEEE